MRTDTDDHFEKLLPPYNALTYYVYNILCNHTPVRTVISHILPFFKTTVFCMQERIHYTSFPRHHYENARLYQIAHIVSACMSKESQFSFHNLGKGVRVLFGVHPECSHLFFSPSSSSAAFFDSTTFQLLSIFSSSFFKVHPSAPYVMTGHMSAFTNLILSYFRVSLSFHIVSSSTVAFFALPITVVPATAGHRWFRGKVALRGRWPLVTGNGHMRHYVKSNTHIRQHIFHSTCTTL